MTKLPGSINLPTSNGAGATDGAEAGAGAGAGAGAATGSGSGSGSGHYAQIWRRFRSRRIGLLALATLGLLAIACVIGPLVLPPDSSNAYNGYAGISWAHPFGTDQIGRDLMTRTLLGGRISMMVGLTAMALTIVVASVLGALAGFFGGIIDTALSALTNAILSVPSLLILVIFAKIGKQDVLSIVIGIALVSWPSTARIVRGAVLSLREKEYIEAARALGTSNLRIITRHILPNALGPILVAATLTIGAAILIESALSFLGVGIGPPIATWGSLLDDGREAINSQNDFLFPLWPGVCILVTVLCFNYIGDALRDAFDPRALERV